MQEKLVSRPGLLYFLAILNSELQSAVRDASHLLHISSTTALSNTAP